MDVTKMWNRYRVLVVTAIGTAGMVCLVVPGAQVAAPILGALAAGLGAGINMKPVKPKPPKPPAVPMK